MNPKIKSKWLKALKSGKYEKGKGELRSGDQFCCLGVLCDLHAKTFKEDWANECYLAQASMLPDEVQDWAQISDNGYFEEGSIGNSLIRINDRSKTFAPVIEAIEKYF